MPRTKTATVSAAEAAIQEHASLREAALEAADVAADAIVAAGAAYDRTQAAARAEGVRGPELIDITSRRAQRAVKITARRPFKDVAGNPRPRGGVIKAGKNADPLRPLRRLMDAARKTRF